MAIAVSREKSISNIHRLSKSSSAGSLFYPEGIGFYHERKDDVRNVGLGCEHDLSSLAADALGLMAICYEQPGRAGSFNRPIRNVEPAVRAIRPSQFVIVTRSSHSGMRRLAQARNP